MDKEPGTNSRTGGSRISIREMLLIMAFVAAILALYPHLRGFSESSFYRSTDWNGLVRLVADKEKLQSNIVSNSGGSSSGSMFSEDDVTITIDNSSARTALLTAMFFHLKEELENHGCRVYSWGHSGKLEDESISGFHFRYRTGASDGIIRVESEKVQDGKCWISIFATEM